MTETEPGKPRVSLILLAYNQEQTVRAAALSCLRQDCEPIEIVLSDDASTDGTFAILQELAGNYRGPHQVSARRNDCNVGIGEHYNRLLPQTSGALLINAAGDDISLPHRARRLIESWDATGGRADLIASHVIDLDHDGTLHAVIRVDDLAPYRDLGQWMARRPYIIGAGHAFTRRMMERFGPLGREVFYEDQIMVFRAMMGGGAVTIDEPLVHYRRGGTSRRPRFDEPGHMASWTDRQCRREQAEMEQLIRDAAVVGCEAPVRARFEVPLKKVHYLRALHRATTRAERWKAFCDAASLPIWWRLRKFLHVALPRLSFGIRRGLSTLHRSRR